MDTDADMQMSKQSSANTNQHLEQFIILGKTARGAALKPLIIQVLEANGVYVFGEFLALPCITEVRDLFVVESYPWVGHCVNQISMFKLQVQSKSCLKKVAFQ